MPEFTETNSTFPSYVNFIIWNLSRSPNFPQHLVTAKQVIYSDLHYNINSETTHHTLYSIHTHIYVSVYIYIDVYMHLLYVYNVCYKSIKEAKEFKKALLEAGVDSNCCWLKKFIRPFWTCVLCKSSLYS